jgi:hypothetical protein
LADVTGIREDLFDRSVFAARIRGSNGSPCRLNQADIAALNSSQVQRVARKLGYALPNECPSRLANLGRSPPLYSVRLINPISATIFRATNAVARSFSLAGNFLTKGLHNSSIVRLSQNESTTAGSTK